MLVLKSEWDYSDFKNAFFHHTGLDLNLYKDKQMERRIRQLIQREEKRGFKEFYAYLAAAPSALERFMNYLTINTSEFFRDEKVYNHLVAEIIPELIKYFPGRLVIWSAGCSIGAEPYTIAIIMDRLRVLSRLEIHATDVDDKALLIAQKGCYNQKQLGKTLPDVVNKYFLQESDLFYVKPEIRQAVKFRRHNLLTDDPVSGCHMILCRNVFIYFKPETQHFLLQRFSASLKPGGFMVIGSSEYISHPAQYSLIKRANTNTIFQKTADAAFLKE